MVSQPIVSFGAETKYRATLEEGAISLGRITRKQMQLDLWSGSGYCAWPQMGICRSQVPSATK